ncbi:MAG: sugar phosphate isomerase/epimerase family protein [Spirochaetia bacterium]
MKNKVGVVTSTYPKNTADEALDGISKAGFKYVELASAPSYFEHILPRPEEADEKGVQKVLDQCARYGLELYCIAGHTRLLTEGGKEAFKSVLDYARMAGVSFVTTDTGEVKDENDKKRFYSDISELAEYAKSKDVTICLEMHGSWCNNGKTGAEIIRTVDHPNVRLNYDTGNVSLYGGVRPEKDIENALPYMAFLHIKENGGGLKEWNFPALGEGNNDFDFIFKKLEEYTGPISVEIEFDGSDKSLDEINKAVRTSYLFLKEHGYVE